MGFGIKVPIFPFHTWLPDAHTQAPTVGSVILAAVLLKLGTYGFIRVALPILPEASAEWAPIIGARGGHLRRPRLPGADRHEAAHRLLVGVPHGLHHAGHRDAHRLRAWPRHGHGRTASSPGMLFFVAGSVKERYHTLEILLGGILLKAPQPGLDPGLHRHGLARPAGPGRVLGRVPAIPRPTSPAPA